MSKSERVTPLCVQDSDGLDPHYAGWFACFNRGDYYEAHDVLEALWLRQRGGPNDRFYKGLIQLAGAFVHLRKDRLRPADALFRLATGNLESYSPLHERLDLEAVLALIGEWRGELAAGGFASNPLAQRTPPALRPQGTSPVRVRSFQEQDLPAVADLFRASILGLAARDYTVDQLAAWSAHPERLRVPGRLHGPTRETLVAERGEGLAGFMTYEADGRIDLLYTHPDHARRGAASALLASAERALHQRGVARVFTEASRTARPFFQRHGYVVLTSQEVEIGGQRLLNFQMAKHSTSHGNADGAELGL